MIRKLLLVFFLLVSIFINGQQDTAIQINEYQEKLNDIDKQSIKTKYLLNKGFMMSGSLKDFLEFGDNYYDAFTEIDRKKFRVIYNGIRKSDLRKNKKLPKFNFKELKTKFDNKPNSIPLGLVQIKGEYLDSLEINQNIQKSTSSISNDRLYSKYFIFNGSVLKKKV